MVYPGKTVSLDFTLLNNSNQDLSSLTPQISIYDMDYARNPLRLYNENAITVKGNSQLQFTYSLPTFDYAPKVYAGEMILTDEDGINRINPIKFRYIVYGDVVNIHNVFVESGSVRAGQKVDVSVSYSGAPYDIVTARVASSTPADFSISLFNEKNELVANYKDKTSFVGVGTKKVSLVSSGDAEFFKVEVYVSRDGKKITEYKTTLSDDPKEESKSALYAIALSLSVLIIIFLSCILFKRKKARALLLLIVLFGLGAVSQNAFAFVVTSIYDSNQRVTHPNIVVTSPSPSSIRTYSPGESFFLVGDTTALACNNSDYKIKVSKSSDGVNWTEIRNTGALHTNCSGGDEEWCNTASVHFSSAHTAPVTPGTYRVYVKVESYIDYLGPFVSIGYTVGYQEYVVPSPLVNGTCGSATSTAVDVAPTSNLCSAGTASAVTGSGPWTWTCADSNGGATSPVCTAPKKIVPGCTSSCSGNGSSSNISPISGSTYTPCGTAKVNLSWTNPTPANTIYYKIYRDGSSTSFAVHNVTGEPTTITAAVNSISGSHTYRVKACSSNTCTDDYSPATASILSSNPCAGPGIDIVAEKKCDVSNNKSILITVSADAGTTYSVTRNGLQIIANPGTQAYDSPAASGNYTYVMNATSSADGNPTSTDTATVTNYAPGSCGAAINCSISSINASKETNINSNTVWTASSSAAIANYNRTWTITDKGVVSTSTATVLNKIFTTIGLKTVALSLSTTTADGFYVSGNCSPVATTTIVFEGGINER